MNRSLVVAAVTSWMLGPQSIAVLFLSVAPYTVAPQAPPASTRCSSERWSLRSPRLVSMSRRSTFAAPTLSSGTSEGLTRSDRCGSIMSMQTPRASAGGSTATTAIASPCRSRNCKSACCCSVQGCNLRAFGLRVAQHCSAAIMPKTRPKLGMIASERSQQLSSAGIVRAGTASSSTWTGSTVSAAVCSSSPTSATCPTPCLWTSSSTVWRTRASVAVIGTMTSGGCRGWWRGSGRGASGGRCRGALRRRAKGSGRG